MDNKDEDRLFISFILCSPILGALFWIKDFEKYDELTFQALIDTAFDIAVHSFVIIFFIILFVGFGHMFLVLADDWLQFSTHEKVKKRIVFITLYLVIVFILALLVIAFR